jgi:hypothetical protein
MKVYKLCNTCGGVVDGNIFNADTGERPCSCKSILNNALVKASIKRFVKKLTQKPEAVQKEIHWKNGRERHNSKQP